MLLGIGIVILPYLIVGTDEAACGPDGPKFRWANVSTVRLLLSSRTGSGVEVLS